MGDSKIELLERQLAEEKRARGSLEAKMETLLQLIAAKSEPERLQMLEKQETLRRKTEVRAAAISVAQKYLKGPKEKVTHVRYVTSAYYQRKGQHYPPGTVLKIPVTELPAEDWKAWKQPVVTRPVDIDPDARGTPFGETRASNSAISAVRSDEAKATADAIARGDVVISAGAADTTPDQGERLPPASVEEHLQQQGAPAAEQGPESALTTRASDTDVG